MVIKYVIESFACQAELKVILTNEGKYLLDCYEFFVLVLFKSLELMLMEFL